VLLAPVGDTSVKSNDVRFGSKADIQTGLAGFTSKLSRRISIARCLARRSGQHTPARMAFNIPIDPSTAVRAFAMQHASDFWLS